ncbi:hypothetical protein SAY87_012546 [Trapa incisa]|uniref:Uncharacterized protein n=1 Tax=Trapa incisa TaxID=236973 RepID=A0AAN7GXZ8_9MYRT|nr:hypothetical protein SAY87_012546 [Trapa incisa]
MCCRFSQRQIAFSIRKNQNKDIHNCLNIDGRLSSPSNYHRENGGTIIPFVKCEAKIAAKGKVQSMVHRLHNLNKKRQVNPLKVIKKCGHMTIGCISRNKKD